MTSLSPQQVRAEPEMMGLAIFPLTLHPDLGMPSTREGRSSGREGAPDRWKCVEPCARGRKHLVHGVLGTLLGHRAWLLLPAGVTRRRTGKWPCAVERMANLSAVAPRQVGSSEGIYVSVRGALVGRCLVPGQGGREQTHQLRLPQACQPVQVWDKHDGRSGLLNV